MFKKVLVPLDRSPLAEQALEPAAAIARMSHAAIDLVLVHEAPGFLGVRAAPTKEMEHWHGDDMYLEGIAADLGTGTGVPVTHAVPKGETVATICSRARQVAADLIVMTSHGRTGFSRSWMGSVADGVVRRSSIPVLMLRPSAGKVPAVSVQPLFNRILVALDGSARAAEILTPACDLARCGNARLVLLRVVPPVPLAAGEPTDTTIAQDEAATRLLVDEARQDLRKIVRTLADRGAVDVESNVVVAPHVAHAIIKFAKSHHVDVIAMATQGRGASRLLVGSVADKVLRGSGLPILICRPVGVVAERAMLDSASIEEQLPALSGL